MSRTRLARGAGIDADWEPAPSHAPVANTQATATRAAPGANKRNVCTGFVVSLCAGATAPTATTVTVAVIDGSSGGATFLWGPTRLAIPAVAGAMNGIARQGLWLQGTANTPITIEFNAAAGANTFESVVMEGTTEPA